MLWAAQSFGLYEWLKVLWAQGSRCYNEPVTVDDMNDFELWAKGSRIYEQVRVVDDMNDSRFRELSALDGMNNLGMWMTWRT